MQPDHNNSINFTKSNVRITSQLSGELLPDSPSLGGSQNKAVNLSLERLPLFEIILMAIAIHGCTRKLAIFLVLLVSVAIVATQFARFVQIGVLEQVAGRLQADE